MRFGGVSSQADLGFSLFLPHAQCFPEQPRFPSAGEEQNKHKEMSFDAKVQRVRKTTEQHPPEIRIHLQKNLRIAFYRCDCAVIVSNEIMSQTFTPLFVLLECFRDVVHQLWPELGNVIHRRFARRSLNSSKVRAVSGFWRCAAQRSSSNARSASETGRLCGGAAIESQSSSTSCSFSSVLSFSS
jgi:hypothetical protein